MNFSDAISSTVFCPLILMWVRRFVGTQTRVPAWDEWLKKSWLVFGVFVGVAAVFDIAWPLILLWFILTGVLGYTAWLLKTYQPAKTLFQGLLPFLIVLSVSKLIKAVAPGFADEYEKAFGLIITASVTGLIASFIFANRQKKEWIKREAERAEEAEQRRIAEAKKQELEYLVTERTAEITRQKEELQVALSELKAVQNQLIQQEKLASLGELTAGIAHEIQNPLNFVNNFSEVSQELVQEIKDERQKTKDQRDEGLELELLEDLVQNLQKIHHHGGRASSIVKGMLQHSRASTGQRELTDLNALADEYLKLAYHGLRAKDKSFNARFDLKADPGIGLVSVVPQDIGRVLLNLYNNAFYATQQRSKQAEMGYQPTVTVQTECVGKMVQIRVRDNGMGMPDAVEAKIFQPFFTTKPTGEGTGLGLSLAYDIVTKGHGGTIDVDSVEGEGTEFVVTLPA